MVNEYNGEINSVIMERDEDMSYEFFKKLLSYAEEFVLYYQDRKFYISQRKDLGELYFTVAEEDYHIFYSPKELLSAPLIDGETWEMRVVLLPIYYKDENRIEICQIFIRDSEELCILDVDRDSGFKRYEADSFFEALTNYRLDLEKEGGILQCNGADKCVFPSPMQMNFGGEKAYFLEMGKQASLNNVYEIFDQDKPNLNCVSVAEQKQFYDDWFISLVGGSH